MAMTWNGDALAAEVRARAAEASRQAAELVLERARAESPVETGRLRDSGHLEEQADGGVRVVFDAPHAAAVEAGDARTLPDPFLERALVASAAEVRAIFARVAGR